MAQPDEKEPPYEWPPTHRFESDPDATLPSVYCRCGYDIDVHPKDDDA